MTSFLVLAVSVISIASVLAYRYFGYINSRSIIDTCRQIVNSYTGSIVSSNYILPVTKIIFLTIIFLAFCSLLKGLITPVFINIKLNKNVPVDLSKHPYLKEIFNEIFGSRKPKVYIKNTKKPVAFTIGVFKPSIYLSKGVIDNLSSDEIKALILHEAAHIKNKDSVTLWLASLLRDFLFYLPISHWLYKFLKDEKEASADDFVLNTLKSPFDLASAIVKVSKMSVLNKNYANAILFSEQKNVEGRIKRLLGERYNYKLSFISFVVSIVASAVILLSLIGIAFALPSTQQLSGNNVQNSQTTCSNQSVRNSTQQI